MKISGEDVFELRWRNENVEDNRQLWVTSTKLPSEAITRWKNECFYFICGDPKGALKTEDFASKRGEVDESYSNPRQDFGSDATNKFEERFMRRKCTYNFGRGGRHLRGGRDCGFRLRGGGGDRGGGSGRDWRRRTVVVARSVVRRRLSRRQEELLAGRTPTGSWIRSLCQCHGHQARYDDDDGLTNGTNVQERLLQTSVDCSCLTFMSEDICCDEGSLPRSVSFIALACASKFHPTAGQGVSHQRCDVTYLPHAVLLRHCGVVLRFSGAQTTMYFPLRAPARLHIHAQIGCSDNLVWKTR